MITIIYLEDKLYNTLLFNRFKRCNHQDANPWMDGWILTHAFNKTMHLQHRSIDLLQLHASKQYLPNFEYLNEPKIATPVYS